MFMTYFNYHAKIKNLIKTGQTIYFELLPEYNHISPAMVFYFKNNPPMPVREYKFDEYFELIEKYKIPEKSKKTQKT